jgi:hypothetical protein
VTSCRAKKNLEINEKITVDYSHLCQYLLGGLRSFVNFKSLLYCEEFEKIRKSPTELAKKVLWLLKFTTFGNLSGIFATQLAKITLLV